MSKARWKLAHIRAFDFVFSYRRVNGDYGAQLHNTSESLYPFTLINRGDRIRTCDFLVPNQAL